MAVTNTKDLRGFAGGFKRAKADDTVQTLEDLFPGILNESSPGRPASGCDIQVDVKDVSGLAEGKDVRYTVDTVLGTDPIQDGATSTGVTMPAGGVIELQTIQEMEAFKIVSAVTGEEAVLQIVQYYATAQ